MTKPTNLRSQPELPERWEERVADAAQILAAIAADRGLLAFVGHADRELLLQSAGRVMHPEQVERLRLSRVRRRKDVLEKRQADEDLLDKTGIRLARSKPVFVTPYRPAPAEMPLEREEGEEAPRVTNARNCYVCKTDYDEIHAFYDQLCPECAAFNWTKRSQTADLSGRTALITGARVKIGYQAAIMLLRAGARVIVVTRFPRDAAQRYAREPDFDTWHGRLSIYGLDLRHTPSVETFTTFLCETEDRMDFIINNACQTVRRPAGFYEHLMLAETEPLSALPEKTQGLVEAYERFRAGSLRDAMPGLTDHPPAEGASVGTSVDPSDDAGTGNEGPDGAPRMTGTSALLEDPLATIAHATGILHAAALSQVPLLDEDERRDPTLFPDGRLDADLQQVDLREKNSWRLGLSEVPAVELLEVHLVNAVAPFILNARLKPLMLRHPSADKHIVNVSAVEGQFYRAFKTDKHPHTNMAKAALNMMTRTSAPDYVRHGIHMNSVDTGWVTDEDPVALAEAKREEHRFHPPLDIVDGAARIIDPIVDGINTGEHVWGQFLKDYKPTDW